MTLKWWGRKLWPVVAGRSDGRWWYVAVVATSTTAASPKLSLQLLEFTASLPMMMGWFLVIGWLLLEERERIVNAVKWRERIVSAVKWRES